MDSKDIEKALNLLREFADGPFIEYGHGDDDPGACIHCGKISYKPHEKDCLIKRTQEFLNEIS